MKLNKKLIKQVIILTAATLLHSLSVKAEMGTAGYGGISPGMGMGVGGLMPGGIGTPGITLGGGSQHPDAMKPLPIPKEDSEFSLATRKFFGDLVHLAYDPNYLFESFKGEYNHISDYHRNTFSNSGQAQSNTDSLLNPLTPEMLAFILNKKAYGINVDTLNPAASQQYLPKNGLEFIIEKMARDIDSDLKFLQEIMVETPDPDQITLKIDEMKLQLEKFKFLTDKMPKPDFNRKVLRRCELPTVKTVNDKPITIPGKCTSTDLRQFQEKLTTEVAMMLRDKDFKIAELKKQNEIKSAQPKAPIIITETNRTKCAANLKKYLNENGIYSPKQIIRSEQRRLQLGLTESYVEKYEGANLSFCDTTKVIFFNKKNTKFVSIREIKAFSDEFTDAELYPELPLTATQSEYMRIIRGNPNGDQFSSKPAAQ